MSLEVIERAPEGNVSGPPILFLHGYWEAAWCWDEFVLPALANRSRHVIAMSFTGHGESEGKIRGQSIKDSVADVVSIVDGLDEIPVIVAHSMGGFVAQHYLAAGHPARGAVLVSPVPNNGAWGATFKVARHHPVRFIKANLTLDIGAVVERPDVAYDLLFGPAVSRGEADIYFERWHRASYRTYLDLLFNPPDLSKVDLPIVVIGGGEDGFFDVRECERMTEALQADLMILDGAGHEIMLEPSWEPLVDEIDSFVAGLPEH
jgi:pimeloyl-ACP methyl ester carboxylesterase